MTRKAASPFNHLASLNLFREPDGTHEITVAGGGDREFMAEAAAHGRPIDHIENLIIAAAKRMERRKRADGSFRDFDL